jgi:hypothetical protein
MLRELAGDYASFFQITTVDELAESIIGWIALHTSYRQLTLRTTAYSPEQQLAERVKAMIFNCGWNMVWRPECKFAEERHY